MALENQAVLDQEEAVVSAADEVTTQDGDKSKKEKVFTQAQFEAILARKQSKWESQLSEMKGQVEKLSSALMEKQESTLTVEEKLNHYKEQLKKLEDEKANIVEKHKGKTLENELLKACGKTTRPEIVAKLLKDKVKIDENDKVYGVDKYDSPVGLDEMVAEFTKEYPEFAPAPKGGTGVVAKGIVGKPPEHKIPANLSAYEYDKYISGLLSGK